MDASAPPRALGEDAQSRPTVGPRHIQRVKSSAAPAERRLLRGSPRATRVLLSPGGADGSTDMLPGMGRSRASLSRRPSAGAARRAARAAPARTGHVGDPLRRADGDQDDRRGRRGGRRGTQGARHAPRASLPTPTAPTSNRGVDLQMRIDLTPLQNPRPSS